MAAIREKSEQAWIVLECQWSRYNEVGIAVLIEICGEQSEEVVVGSQHGRRSECPVAGSREQADLLIGVIWVVQIGDHEVERCLAAMEVIEHHVVRRRSKRDEGRFVKGAVS